MKQKPVVLMILDGYGLNDNPAGLWRVFLLLRDMPAVWR